MHRLQRKHREFWSRKATIRLKVCDEQGTRPIYAGEFEKNPVKSTSKLTSGYSEFIGEHEYSLLLVLVVCYANLATQL